jgi:hypothetical protein
MSFSERRARSLDAIARDDAFLDELGESADPLAVALTAWRQDLDAEPVHRARSSRVTVLRRRVGRGVAAAAVASAVGLGSVTGMAAAATHAQPGSALWPITRMVAPERAASRLAAHEVRASLARAASAAAADHQDEAARYLALAERDASRVRGDDGGAELRGRTEELRRQLDGAPEGQADPSPSTAPAPSETSTASPSPSATPSATGSPRPIFPREEPTPSPSPSGTTAPSPEPAPAPEPESERGRTGERSPQPSPSPESQSDPTLGLLELLFPEMFGRS